MNKPFSNSVLCDLRKLIVYVIFIIFILLLIMSLCCCEYCSILIDIKNLFMLETKLSNEEKLQIISIFIVITGGIWAYISYFSIKRRDQNDFVKIRLNITIENEDVYLHTFVENPVNKKKKIRFAMLMINKTEDEFKNSNELKRICEILNQSEIKKTNDLIKLENCNQTISEKDAFIPLGYYYDENVNVGNEELAYTFILTKEIRRLLNKEGYYEVRFFVFSSEGHLHRSVQNAFSLKQCNKLNH